MKQKLLRLLRAMRLLPLAEKVYGRLIRIEVRRANRVFLRENPGVVTPPPELMVDPYGAVDFGEYWRSGRVVAAGIADLVEKYQPGEPRSLRVLDWGCGPARVIRHLRNHRVFATAVLTGCDFNPACVSWARSTIRDATFEVNDLIPPLPFGDDAFDILFGVSIFTHLSETNHLLWCDELNRVLAPGGLLLLTFQGLAYRGKLLPDERAVFDEGRIVVRGGVDEGRRMYCSFHPEDFVRSLFADGFEVLAFFHGPTEGIAPPQDTILLRKPR